MLYFFIAKGDKDAIDNKGNNPLYLACKAEKLEVAGELLTNNKYTIDDTTEGIHGSSPLLDAVRDSNGIGMLNLLLQRAPKQNVQKALSEAIG